MNTTRQELMLALAEVHAALPAMRYGQLIANMIFLAKGTASSTDLWDIEDEELLAAAREQLAQLQAINAGSGAAQEQGQDATTAR